MEQNDVFKKLPLHTKTLKVEVRVWNSLKHLKKENETFNDVIKGLLNERTVSVEKNNVKAIKYSRNILVLEVSYHDKRIGIELEYNDVKNNQTDFTLDLEIKKIFHRKKIFNHSQFFGVDSQHKHLNPLYLDFYLKGVVSVLEKEFGFYLDMYKRYKNLEDLAQWRFMYYQYNLSQESFIHDIEEPLRLSEEEKPTKEQERRIKESMAYSVWKN